MMAILQPINLPATVNTFACLPEERVIYELNRRNSLIPIRLLKTFSKSYLTDSSFVGMTSKNHCNKQFGSCKPFASYGFDTLKGHHTNTSLKSGFLSNTAFANGQTGEIFSPCERAYSTVRCTSS